MIINKRHIPYQLPIDINWYSQHTQAMVNSLPVWMTIRQDQDSIGQQFLNSMAIGIQELTAESLRAQANRYLSTADLVEPDLIYKIIMQRSTTVDIDNLHVESASGIIVEQVKSVQDLFVKLPTRIEYIENTVVPSSILGFNEPILDPEMRKVEVWEPDTTEPYKEIRQLMHQVVDNKIQLIDRDNTREIYGEFSIDYSDMDTDLSDGTILDVAAYRNWLWALVEESSNYYVVATNKYTTAPTPSSLVAYSVLEIPDASGTNLVGFDNDASGFFWTKSESDEYKQYKLCHDYYLVDKTTWIMYLRESYPEGLIVT